jgi:hypothetical protein
LIDHLDGCVQASKYGPHQLLQCYIPVGNDRALTKDDIIKGACSFPNRVSNPGKLNLKPKSEENVNSLDVLDLG